jgi:hypothetical protein
MNPTKKLLAAGGAVACLLGTAILSVQGKPDPRPSSEIAVRVEAKNPWTSLGLANDRRNFQFAIVSDRTGGHRPGVFSKAVEKLNLMQPEFVMSVGDLVEGYTEDPAKWEAEWSEFVGKIDRLEMPFFLCAGNHDVSNSKMLGEWQRRFGRTYYDFVYRDVLFLVLDSEEIVHLPGDPKQKPPYLFGPGQLDWIDRTLQRHSGVRWTFLFLHKPTWTYPGADHETLGWNAVERSLRGRKYTVFAGHKHQYAKSVRHGREHYMLATTGGSSKLQGLPHGQFDHFVWVTMRDDGPVLANVLLDGIVDEDVRTQPDWAPAPPLPESAERPAAEGGAARGAGPVVPSRTPNPDGKAP